MLPAEFLLTADELNSLIAHAHRRMEQLEKQLAEQQSAEQRQIDAALGHLKQENELLADERLKQERQKMQAELEMLKQQWVMIIICYLYRTRTSNLVHDNGTSAVLMYQFSAPCWLWGCKNRLASFPGLMSYKATKPGLVSVLCLSMHYMVLLFIRAPFYVLLVFVALHSVFWLFWLSYQ